MLKKFFQNTVDAAKRYAPSALTPEKRFAKAIISASSLLTMADGKAEESEIEAASTIIFSHRSIKQFLTPAEAQEMYAMQIEKLQQANIKGKVPFSLEVNGLVAEIADSVADRQWRAEVLETAKMVGESNGNGRLGDDEQAILKKLQTAMA